MLVAPKKLTVTVTKTATGEHDYIQIISADQFSLNIVLIADEIVMRDARPVPASGEVTTPFTSDRNPPPPRKKGRK